ncbi:Ankyrin repeat family A protein 2 [Orchesella cincta]|uniref:Ankyrin repeat family A protein 2 n=1 Tax=Orchesella cincta TaxID=48709 RepID=A0A1D2NMQ7_ORCCI|nr:Ankyrin repeat family A protein 2 [Orchesella cincta]
MSDWEEEEEDYPLPLCFDSSADRRYFSARSLAKLCAVGTVREIQMFLTLSNISVHEALDVGCEPIGWSCLMYACLGQNRGAISYLLSLNSNPNFCTTDGLTPLMVVVAASDPPFSENDVRCAKILVRKGARVSNLPTYEGRTLLTMAVSKGVMDLVIFLWDKGARVNQTDARGETPLNIAVAGNMLQMVELLITLGANPRIRNLDGNGSLDLAAGIDNPNGAAKMIEYLKFHERVEKDLEKEDDDDDAVSYECERNNSSRSFLKSDVFM